MQKMHVNPFKVGCDPEFCVVDPQNPTTLITVGNVNSSGFGADHGGYCVELRPPASYFTSDIVNELKDILESPTGRPFRKFRWRSGAFVPYTSVVTHTNAPVEDEYSRSPRHMSIGGHIHLELPFKGKHGVPDKVFDERLNACDRITEVMESIDLLPGEESDRRRTDPAGYGQFGATAIANTQTQSADGTHFYRTEYRTPCSWLFDPHNAMIMLTATKLAALNPGFAKTMLPLRGTKEAKFQKLVKFFRAYQNVDFDAAVVAKRILKNDKMETLEKFAPRLDEDMKPRWENFKHIA
jgi:hypothetical protein